MAEDVRILLLADSDREVAWLTATLRAGHCAAVHVRVEDEASCRSRLEQESWDLVLAAVTEAGAPAALRAVRDRIGGIDPPLVILADRFEQAAEAAQRLGATVCLREAGFAHLGPALERASRERPYRDERPGGAAFEEGQREILESIAMGKPLPEVLEQIVLLIERQGDGMLCSILLLDRESGRVHHGAAPHLPHEFNQQIDGAPIGPQEGSCGAAAYLRRSVIIDDIASHPNWVNYRHLALPYGLRSCWSTPILSAHRAEVLGTFAMYYKEPRTPSARERHWVDRAAYLASIAISRDLAEKTARRADARYRQIVDTAYEGVWLLDAEGRTLFVNGRTARMLGHEPDELLGRPMTDFVEESGRAAARGLVGQRLKTTSDQVELPLRRKDGSSFWALVCGSPIRDEKQVVVGALGMITDISEIKQTEEALRRSEAEFRVVFESAALGMALVDGAGQVVRANPALQQFLGRPEAEIAGHTLAQLCHPDDRRAALDLYPTLTERDSYQTETRFLCKDGAPVWGRLTASLVRTSAGMARSTIVMVEDVTERRRMEEAVRASERLRTLMYGAVSDILFYLSVEPGTVYRFLSVNPAFLRATGMAEDQIVGRKVDEVIPEPSRALVLRNYARAIEQRATVTWDEVTVYPAGTRYGEVTITPIFDGDGQCTNLLGTVHDVTERKVSEQRLAAQAALLDKAKDAILVVELDGTIRYWNKGAERLYGWTSDEAIGRRVRELIHKDAATFDEARRLMMEAGEWSGQLPQVNKAGQPIIAEVSATVIRDEQGQPHSVFAIGTDITERRRLEAQIFHAQRLDSLGTLASGVAHDFNNLLAAILGNTALALRELPPDHPVREVMLEVEVAGERGADLVKRLLTFSRREAPARQPLKLQPLVDEALRLLRASLPRAFRLETNLSPDAPEILADPTQIHQIVMNLGTNAAHAIDGIGGTIDVKVERVVLEHPLDTRSATLRPGTYARLVVADSGCGMEPATLERIFDPFYTTKGPGRGTGLGLSVVDGIVGNHDGGIVVRSAPGQGTEFSVYFPAVR